MKVLIPTDFSPTAGYAFDTALALAGKREIELHLFHVPEIPSGWEYLPALERYKDELNKEIAVAARDQLQVLQAKAEAKDVKCDIHYSGGDFLTAFGDKVKELGVELVVMGSHGAGGKKEWFIGSNTQKALRKLDCNLLVVKSPLDTIDFTRVMFATNLNKEDQKAFERFLAFIKYFPIVDIHLLTVRTGSFFGTPKIVIQAAQEDFVRLARRYRVHAHEVESISVDSGIREFTEKHGIHLIGMSNLRHRPVRHFLRGSNVEMIINHADVPVLSIDFIA